MQVIVILCFVFWIDQPVNGLPNYYDVLGVPFHATANEIKKAYRELSKKYHPDVTTFSSEGAKEKMIRLNEARMTLLDQAKKEEYDTLLRRVESMGLMDYIDGGFPEIVIVCLACPEYLSLKGFSPHFAHALCTLMIMFHIPIAFLLYVSSEFIRWREPALIPICFLEKAISVALRISVFFVFSLWCCHLTLYLDTLWFSFLVFGVGFFSLLYYTPRNSRLYIVDKLTAMIYFPEEVVVEGEDGDMYIRYVRASTLARNENRKPTQEGSRTGKSRRSHGAASLAPKVKVPTEVAVIEPGGGDFASVGSDNATQTGNEFLHPTNGETGPTLVPSEEPQKPSDPAIWTSEDQKFLERALKKYPIGTIERWEKVSQAMHRTSQGKIAKSPHDCRERFRSLCQVHRETRIENFSVTGDDSAKRK